MSDSNTNAEMKSDVPNLSESSLPHALLLRHRKPLIILAHIVVFAVSLILSFLLANNMQFKRNWLVEQYPTLLLFFIIIKLAVFGFFRQYRGWWRYVGISDLIGIAAASLISTLIIVVLWFVLVLNIEPIRKSLQAIADTSQSVFMLDMFTTVLLLAGLRMVIRLYYEEFRTVEGGHIKRFLIVGAGNTGEALLREIHRMSIAQYEVVGFIDDAAIKQGISIHGISVLGTVEQLPNICGERNIEEIAIAMPSATPQQTRRVVQVCQGAKVRFRTVPSLTDIASGKFRVSQIRDVDINDLLGREAIQLDLNLIEAFLKDKTIMVTGAGGSIGSEMCRQVCIFRPKLLLLVEQAENPLFHIERELSGHFPEINLKAIICDITDKTRVEEIFEKYKPQVVIHAAAHKHVPLMELNPGEALKNNIMGTRTVADASEKYGTVNFVMISTDKAVNPTSIMGSSKRIAEMYIQDLNRTSKTHFVTVRFGNVLDSSGSVVPIFKQQIAQGGPVTVTHPEMKRYFMTIPEASQLVLQAATMGQGGEIFVLDMGEPVKIVDLAKELITLSGFVPGQDIEIVFTGPRPGEKLFEELSITGEDMLPTRHPKIGIWKNIPKDRDKLFAGINELAIIAQTQDHAKIAQKIKELVPTYIGNSNHLN
ncbi:MAG: nucleoside-diphosphate sugar epimerase/dehydratase [Planctomycetota bacterium]|nr:nucleoside-diphosphate sugar epimerase/dehydratase [Planctomycetota bacterium]